jgi:hypothetical protein
MQRIPFRRPIFAKRRVVHRPVFARRRIVHQPTFARRIVIHRGIQKRRQRRRQRRPITTSEELEQHIEETHEQELLRQYHNEQRDERIRRRNFFKERLQPRQHPIMRELRPPLVGFLPPPEPPEERHEEPMEEGPPPPPPRGVWVGTPPMEFRHATLLNGTVLDTYTWNAQDIHNTANFGLTTVVNNVPVYTISTDEELGWTVDLFTDILNDFKESEYYIENRPYERKFFYGVTINCRFTTMNNYLLCENEEHEFPFGVDREDIQANYRKNIKVKRDVKFLKKEIEHWLNFYRDQDVQIISFQIRKMELNAEEEIHGKDEDDNFVRHPYFMVGSKTKTNCFWVALSLCVTRNIKEHYLIDNEVKVDRGKKLKKKINQIHMTEPNDETMEEAAGLLDHKIRLYDGNLKNYKSFGDDSTEAKIMILEGHAYAMLKLNFVKEKFPDLIENCDKEHIGNLHCGTVINKVFRNKKGNIIYKNIERDSITFFKSYKKDWIFRGLNEESVEKQIVYNKSHSKYSKERFLTWDLETAPHLNNTTHFAYLAGFTGMKLGMHRFEGKDCIKDMMNWCFKKREDLNWVTWFGHNASKFDNLFLLKEYLHLKKEKWKITRITFNAGRILVLEIKSVDKKCNMQFLDSYMFTVCSLETLAKELKVKHQKQKDVDHSKICQENWREFAELKPYFECDIIGLHECMELIIKSKFESTGLDLTHYCTASSISAASFYKNYSSPQYPIYNPSFFQDEYIRRNYEGGRNEAFVIGTLKNKRFFYYDVTSLYPFCGTFDMPFGKGEYLKDMSAFVHDGKLSNDFFGYVEVDFKNKVIPCNEINLIAVKKDLMGGSRLLFPYVEYPQRKVIFSEVIKYVQDENLNYEFNFITGMKYERGPVLRKFFLENYQLRKEARQKGNDAEAQARKLDMNGFYGKNAMKCTNRKNFQVTEKFPKSFRQNIQDGKLLSFSQVPFEQPNYFYQQFLDTSMPKYGCIPIGAAFTAYAQMQIHKFMNMVHKKGHQVCYLDTDSCICENYCLENDPEMKERFQKFGGEELGEMKNEFVGKAKKVLTPEEFNQLDGYYFTDLTILGNKAYCLSRIVNNKVIKCQAQKGVSKANQPRLDQYEQIIKDGEYVVSNENDESEWQSQEIDGEKWNYQTEIVDGKERRISVPLKGQVVFRAALNNILTESKKDQGIKILRIKKTITTNYYKAKVNKDNLEKQGFDYVQPFIVKKDVVE